MAACTLTLDERLSGYRSFMIEFRHALGVGAPANPDGVIVCLPGGRAARFRAGDLYLTDVQTSQGTPWRKLVGENYAQMGLQPDTRFDAGNLRSAVRSGALRPSPELARILLLTAEALRGAGCAARRLPAHH